MYNMFRLAALDDDGGRRLMDLYAESTMENTDYFYPDVTDKKFALRMAEANYLSYIRNEFLPAEGTSYMILKNDDIWVSALRLYRMSPGLYYIQALETHPAHRRKGHASKLLELLIDSLKAEGPFRLYDCVNKKNTASLKTHYKCGFRVVSDTAVELRSGETDENDYGLEYTYEY